MSLFSRFFGKQPPKDGEEQPDAEGAAQEAPASPPGTAPTGAALPQPGPAIPYVPPQGPQRTERMIPVDHRPQQPGVIQARMTPGQFPIGPVQGVMPPMRAPLESEGAIPLHIPEPAVEIGTAPPPSSVDPRFAHWGGRDPNAEIAETVPPVLRYGADGSAKAVGVAAPPDATDLTPTPALGTATPSTPAAPPAPSPSAPSAAASAKAGGVPKAAPSAPSATGKPKRRDSPTNFHQVGPRSPPAPQAPHPGLRPNDALPTIIVDIPQSMPPPAVAGARPPPDTAPVQRNTLRIPGAVSTTPKPVPTAPTSAPRMDAPKPPPSQPRAEAAPQSVKNMPTQRQMSDTRPDPDSQAIMRAAVAYRESKAAVAAASSKPTTGTQPSITTAVPTSPSIATSSGTSTPTPAMAAPAPAPTAAPMRSMMRQKAPTLLGGMVAPTPEPVLPAPAPVAVPPPPSASVVPRYPSAPPPPPPPIASPRAPAFDDDDDDAEGTDEPALLRDEPKTEVNLQDFVPAALAQVAAAALSMKARASVAPQPPDESDWPTASELPDPEEWSKPVVPPPPSQFSSEGGRASVRPPLDSVDDDDAVTEAHISKRPPAPTEAVAIPPSSGDARGIASEPSPMTTRSAHPAPPVEGGELEVISSGPATIPPSAPPPAPHGPEPKLWEGVGMDDVWDEVDKGFGDLGQVQSSRPTDSAVFDDARQLFTEIAATHMHHVRDFMLDLSAAPTTAEWLALCIPATQSLRMGAVAFEMGTLTVALDAFMDALKITSDAGVPIVEGEHRDQLLVAYGSLVKELPNAFKLDGEGRVREGIIVRALLNQLEDVRKVQQDRLFMAGLMSLDALCVAKPRDIVETTGLSQDLATRISERFRRYRLEMSVLAHGNIRGEWDKLREYTDLLSQAHIAFEQASDRNDSKKKKESRRTRELTMLDVKVMLARLGKPDSLNFIERAPFAEKIAHLVALIEQSER